MDIFNSDWLFLVLVLLVGGILGFIAGRAFSNSYKEQQKLSQQLAAVHEALAQYKEQVALHFAETAEAVNVMTQSYSNVHAKLRQGASALCDDPDAADSLIELANRKAHNHVVHTQDSSPRVSPPIDYALPTDADKASDTNESDTQTMLHPPST